MDDAPLEWTRDTWVVSTDRTRLEAMAVLDLLATTHWAGELGTERLARAIANSVCFGVYEGHRLVGFARVVTDQAGFDPGPAPLVVSRAPGSGRSARAPQGTMKTSHHRGIR